MMLVLNVACHDDNTMHVTSNHLEVIPFPSEDDNIDPGEELSKRGESFGFPVGNSMFTHPPYIPIYVNLSKYLKRPARCSSCTNH
jgi:DNA-directed RNA polymerase II subunit RPB3